MKAAFITTYGHSDVVEVGDIAKPTVGRGQVLVEVHAASLNPFDTMVREGKVENPHLVFPFVLGGDIAGLVAEVGEGVDSLNVGDRVYGSANRAGGDSGAFAEFATTMATELALAPSDLNFAEVAALPLVGVSAVQALTENLQLQKGQKLFVHGGAGGIGTVAIQIAKDMGVYVAATATGDGLSYIKELGVDEAIDYKAQDYSKILKDYDAAYDTVGDDFTKMLSILREGGRAISMLAQADAHVAEAQKVTALTQYTQITTKRLDFLRELVEKGAVTPHVDRTFSLDDIQLAFTVRETTPIRGKVVLEIATD